MFKKMCLVVMVCSLFMGCGKFDRLSTSVTGAPSKVCVDGVSYLQFTSGATVQVDINGKPIACK